MRHLAGETQLRFAWNRQPLRFWETRGNGKLLIIEESNFLRQFSLAMEVAFHVELLVKLATFKAISASG